MKKPTNVVSLSDRKKTLHVILKCSVCVKEYPDLIRFNQTIDKLRCPKCVNPVDLVYPEKI